VVMSQSIAELVVQTQQTILGQPAEAAPAPQEQQPVEEQPLAGQHHLAPGQVGGTASTARRRPGAAAGAAA
jgi:hypothetical protein